ncbi:glycosyltransferase [Rhodococcus hoagii]|nr:glycosyltransferase [Prescottella equi]
MPDLIGGGGLEVQMRETAKALEEIGVEVVSQFSGGETVDIIHAFGADPSMWNHLKNWTRNVVPLVLSPVLVISSPAQRRVETVLSRLRFGASNSATMRRAVAVRADRVVALHDGEARDLHRWYGVPYDRISVIGNGSRAEAPEESIDFQREGIVVVGTVGARKRQLELVQWWKSEWPHLYIAGPMSAGWRESDQFATAVRQKDNITYLGRLEPAVLWKLQQRCVATLSASVAEGESLAVIDSLRLGTKAIVRRGPGVSSLTARFGDGVLTYSGPSELDDLLCGRVGAVDSRPPAIPASWNEVARQIADLYASLTWSSADRRL